VAYLSWFPLFIGFNLLYFTMLVLGYQGMPRRYYDHLPQYHTGHLIATVGSWLLVLGLVMLFANFVWSAYRGRKADENPWGGVTLEWTIPSPPPVENFETPPHVADRPYPFPLEARA
jgi:cytochrome c oxidase subunit 1